MPKALIDTLPIETIKDCVDTSVSMREAMKKMGYGSISGDSMNAVKERLSKMNISYDHFTHSTPIERNTENTLCINSTADQKTIKKYYIAGKYTEYKCSICGQLPEWQGKPLTLILDHISGNNTDSRIENLRWVCPNCNQQLETTGFKKMRVKK